MAYKFTWSPVGVFRAINSATYLKNGKNVNVNQEDLLYSSTRINVNNSLNTYHYPNRDSIKYKYLYQIPEAENCYRGTIRYDGYA